MDCKHTTEHLNRIIKEELKDAGGISDGYHTFDQLYECRHLLYMNLCRYGFPRRDFSVTKTRKDHRRQEIPGWFLLCVTARTKTAEQISFHLPDKYWDLCKFAGVEEYNQYYDGHKLTDVQERLKKWL